MLRIEYHVAPEDITYGITEKLNQSKSGNLCRYRFNNERGSPSTMSRGEQIMAWVAIIGGGIGFFFFSQYMVEVMR